MSEDWKDTLKKLKKEEEQKIKQSIQNNTQKAKIKSDRELYGESFENLSEDKSQNIFSDVLKDKILQQKDDILNKLKKEIERFSEKDLFNYSSDEYKSFLKIFDDSIEKFPAFLNEIEEIFIDVNPSIYLHIIETELLSVYFSNKCRTKINADIKKFLLTKVTDSINIRIHKVISIANDILKLRLYNYSSSYIHRGTVADVYKIWLRHNFEIEAINNSNIDNFCEKLDSIKPDNDKNIQFLKQCEDFIFNYITSNHRIKYYLQLYYIHIKYYPKIIESKKDKILSTLNGIGSSSNYDMYYWFFLIKNKKDIIKINENINELVNFVRKSHKLYDLYVLLDILVNFKPNTNEEIINFYFNNLNNNLKKFTVFYFSNDVENNNVNIDFTDHKQLSLLDNVFEFMPKSTASNKLEDMLIQNMGKKPEPKAIQLKEFKNYSFYNRLIIHFFKKMKIGSNDYISFRNSFEKKDIKEALLIVYDIENLLLDD